MIRVVVVDDEELARTGFRLILQAAGDIEPPPVVRTLGGGQPGRPADRTPPTRPHLALPSAQHGLIGLRELRLPTTVTGAASA